VLAITNQNIDARPLRVDWVAGLGLGTGLQLVRSLMPGRGATFSITEEGKTVGVRLRLEPPIIVVSKQAHEAA
jgi:hypothetical protein